MIIQLQVDLPLCTECRLYVGEESQCESFILHAALITCTFAICVLQVIVCFKIMRFYLFIRALFTNIIHICMDHILYWCSGKLVFMKRTKQNYLCRGWATKVRRLCNLSTTIISFFELKIKRVIFSELVQIYKCVFFSMLRMYLTNKRYCQYLGTVSELF